MLEQFSSLKYLSPFAFCVMNGENCFFTLPERSCLISRARVDSSYLSFRISKNLFLFFLAFVDYSGQVDCHHSEAACSKCVGFPVSCYVCFEFAACSGKNGVFFFIRGCVGEV